MKLVIALLGLCVALPAQQTFSQQVDAKMEEIRTSIQGYTVPGAVIAVTFEGRLIYTKGYGVADQTTGAAPSPTTLFRIASVSKSITALAILKLVDQGLLTLDERAFDILSHLQPVGAPDPAVATITVRQLLQHTSGMGGIGPNNSVDPMFEGNQSLADSISASTSDTRPVECSSIIRYQLGRPLTNAPGTGYYYSNFGYCVLGRIIERKSGMSYEAFVRRHVLSPIGVQRMQQGRTLLSGRAPTEARYYTGPADAATGQSVFDPFGLVERPYGVFYLESFDALGGWLGSVVDLARVVSRVDPQSSLPVVSEASLARIVERPVPAPVPDLSPSLPDNFYGLGFAVDLVPNLLPLGNRVTHDGSLAGSRSYITRLASRLGLAVIFNSRHGQTTQDGQMIQQKVGVELVNILVNHRIAGTLPATDLFPAYFKPVISPERVHSEANRQVTTLSPGMYFTIGGSNLGPVARTAAASVNGVLPTSVDGIRVTLNGVNCPIRYVSANEIGAIVPYNVAAGTGRPLVVFSGDEQSTAHLVSITAINPVLYGTDSSGSGTVYAVRKDGTIHSQTKKLSPGETVAVYLSGTGITSPVSGDGAITPRCTSGLGGWGYSCIGGTPSNPVPRSLVTARIGIQFPNLIAVPGAPPGFSPVVYAGNAPLEAAGKTVVLLTVPSGVSGMVDIQLALGLATTPAGLVLWVK
ncbi:MAG: serine hydrolase [Bryobacterales bacterium]|nr:serine hydrolase [Bryobacterales bacterium]